MERSVHRGAALIDCLMLAACLACLGCSASAPITISPGTTPIVTSASTEFATAGKPFEAIVSNSGTVFVSVRAGGTSGSATRIQVFASANGNLQASCVNVLPASLLGSDTFFSNLSFFPGETDIGGGIGFPGAIFYHVADLLGCPATGFVVSQGSTTSNSEGTLAVAVTPDGKFGFVSNESGVAPGAATNGNIGVVTIQRDSNGNFTTATTLVGQIATEGNAIAGMTLSADGTRLYVTSEVAAASTVAAGSNNPVLSKSGCVQAGTTSINGLLTTLVPVVLNR